MESHIASPEGSCLILGSIHLLGASELCLPACMPRQVWVWSLASAHTKYLWCRTASWRRVTTRHMEHGH